MIKRPITPARYRLLTPEQYLSLRQLVRRIEHKTMLATRASKWRKLEVKS